MEHIGWIKARMAVDPTIFQTREFKIPFRYLALKSGHCLLPLWKRFFMGFDQYHEPPEELSEETRTLVRMFASLTEETEAINWYQQRLAVEKDPHAKAIMEDAQKEEFKHFGMDLEFLLRRIPEWRETLKPILFTSGDIVKRGKQGEEAAE